MFFENKTTIAKSMQINKKNQTGINQAFMKRFLFIKFSKKILQQLISKQIIIRLFKYKYIFIGSL